MAEDVVTRRDIAAPASVTLPAQDAQLICNELDEALEEEGYPRTAYSEPVRDLFKVAWGVASLKRSTQVTVFHLAHALAYTEAGKELASSLGSDVKSFAVGCILKFLPLGLSAHGKAKIVPTSIDATRWVGEGVALALKGGKHNELQLMDLVRAVQQGTIPHTVRRQLRAAAKLSARGDAIGPISVQISNAPSSPSEIIKDMEEVEKGRAAAGPTDDLTNLVELLEEFEQRHTVDVADYKQVQASADKRLALIEQRLQPIDNVMSKLEKIDRRLEELPRGAPSGARLAAAIFVVLTLGVAAGLALRSSQLGGSFLAQIFSASVK